MHHPLRILIIDDDPLVRALTRATLQRYIVQFTLAITELADGAQGLAYMTTTEHLPHIVLLDINMPVMDGIGFLAAYEKLPPPAHCPDIYVLSTIADHFAGSAALSHTVTALFEKPLTKDHITTMIERYCFRLCS